jgi:predicted HTH transcriptional regulator
MGAIPTSDMPGHAKLYQRVCNALDRCQESRNVDFKASAAWDDLKLSLTRTVMAMANLRDGGIIVIGASESGDTWDLSGIQQEHLATYDVDDIIDGINRYALPPVQLEVVIVTYQNEKRFLAFQVHEFADTPVLCKRNAPDGNKKLAAGEVYVRPLGVPKTTKVVSADDMHELLELAAEKRARRLLEVAHRVGLRPPEPATQRFDEELGDLP